MCSLHSLSIGYYGVCVHTGTLTHTRTHTLTHTQSTGLSMSHVLVYVYYVWIDEPLWDENDLLVSMAT